MPLIKKASDLLDSKTTSQEAQACANDIDDSLRAILEINGDYEQNYKIVMEICRLRNNQTLMQVEGQKVPDRCAEIQESLNETMQGYEAISVSSAGLDNIYEKLRQGYIQELQIVRGMHGFVGAQGFDIADYLVVNSACIDKTDINDLDALKKVIGIKVEASKAVSTTDEEFVRSMLKKIVACFDATSHDPAKLETQAALSNICFTLKRLKNFNESLADIPKLKTSLKSSGCFDKEFLDSLNNKEIFALYYIGASDHGFGLDKHAVTTLFKEVISPIFNSVDSVLLKHHLVPADKVDSYSIGEDGFLNLLEEYLDSRNAGTYGLQVQTIKAMFRDISGENHHKMFCEVINATNFTDVINEPYKGNYKRYIIDHVKSGKVSRDKLPQSFVERFRKFIDDLPPPPPSCSIM